MEKSCRAPFKKKIVTDGGNLRSAPAEDCAKGPPNSTSRDVSAAKLRIFPENRMVLCLIITTLTFGNIFKTARKRPENGRFGHSRRPGNTALFTLPDTLPPTRPAKSPCQKRDKRKIYSFNPIKTPFIPIFRLFARDFIQNKLNSKLKCSTL